jgi:hypothetical protein
MTTLHDGIFPIELNGERIELKATLGAMRQLTALFHGLAPVRQGIIDQDLSVMVAVIRYGAGLTDAEAKNLDNRIFRHGLGTDLLLGLLRYVAALANGGKPVDENDDAPVAAAADEGNG